MFGMSYVCHRGVRDMIREFLLYSLFGKRSRFLWCASVCATLWMLWDERNRRAFRGVESESGEILSVVHFHVSRWASISKTLCNYPLNVIFCSWILFL